MQSLKHKTTKTIRDSLPPTDGARVCRWIHRHAVLGEGDHFGMPFRLRDWQRRFIYRLYERNPDGTRKYRRALLGVPKGNGKSALVSAIAAYELLGGRHLSPIVLVCAASLRQSDLVFGDLKTMCRESPSLAAVTEPYDLEVLIKGKPGKAQRVCAEAGVNDGVRPTAVIFDELHEFTGRKERVHLVLANGTAKRSESLQLNISTAGWNPESLLGKLYAHGRKVEAGEIEDPSFLFEWHEAPKDCDLSTEEARRAAVLSCNPAAGDFLSLDDILRRYHEMPEFEWKRYHLNMWTSAPERWLPSGSWEACADAARVIPDGSEILVGFDGSWSQDSTALIGLTVDEPYHLFVLDIWEKPLDAGDTWRVDVSAVEARVRQVCERYKVRHVVADSYRWQRSISLLAGEDIPAVDFPTHSVPRMVSACRAFVDAVLSHKLTHDGDPRLAAHIANCVVKEDASGPRITRQSGQQIDCAYASVIAFDTLLSQPPPKRSIYEERGLVII
jgi:phage terminase large subunit-like protein